MWMLSTLNVKNKYKYIQDENVIKKKLEKDKCSFSKLYNSPTFYQSQSYLGLQIVYIIKSERK